MDNLTIETPEQVPLEFPLAGVGSRFLALALDTLIQLVALLLVFVAVMFVPAASLPRSRTWTVALAVLLGFLVQFGYFAFFEAIWHGQTPGKRYTHLRVMQDSGRPITSYDALARNLLRIVDSLPGVYAVGIASALLSSESKRLGDYVAGTVVVHEEPIAGAAVPAPAPQKSEPARSGPIRYLIPAPLPPAPPAPPAAPTPSRVYEAGRLSVEEFQLIEAFLLRRNQLAAGVRARTARQILDRVALKLAILPEEQREEETLLEELARQYRSRIQFR